MKRHEPSPAHEALRDDMIAVLRKHGEHLDPREILAIAAHMVGQIIAMQDQRRTTREMALEIVAANIEWGNSEVVAGILSAEGQA